MGKSGKRSRSQELSCSTVRFVGIAVARPGSDRDDICTAPEEELSMDGIIYLVGLIVIVMAILSLFGLR
jgi:hypothetical protein